MGQKIKLEDKEYEIADLSDTAKANIAALEFATGRMSELNNMRALLERAKRSYMDSLKKEVISKKAGFLIEDE